MTPNSFSQNVGCAGTVLSKIDSGFCKEILSHPLDQKIALVSAYPSKEEYMSVYTRIQTARTYDILLKDESIFQFSLRKGTGGTDILRYVFMQSFRRFRSYEDYCIEEHLTGDDVEDETYREFYYQTDGCYAENHFPFYLRYDYNEATCRGRMHPCSHLHFVLPDSGRIALKKQLNPLTFVMFCVKMAYRDLWERCVGSDESRRLIDSARMQCVDLNGSLWDDEPCDLFLF